LNVIKGPENMAGLTKPTFFLTNEFTAVFQKIVDTYGIPTYKEVNPAVFTCISFPFFFGVMFGDLMHGSILAIFGMYLCFSKREPGTLGETFGEARYLLLLMGIFATYCGAIYNDYTSMGTQTFGKTCYTTDPTKTFKGAVTPMEGQKGYYFSETITEDCVYPFGMDPVWFRST
jgi:V-type H+-transporting ATPase subunit a